MANQPLPLGYGKPEIEMREVADPEINKDLKAIDAGLAVPPTGGFQMTPEEQKLHRKINLKYDLLILPLLTLLYVMSGLDRNNIGNAATVNFTDDMGIPASAVNTGVTIFFATIVAATPPSTYIGKKVGVTRWIPFLMVGWGVFTLALAFAHNEAQFYAFRSMIGILEGGFYPCAAYYIASCYTRYNLALRLGLFYGSYAIGGAFGSLVAYGLLQIRGTSLHSWQWLFIAEGAFTVLIAIFAFFYVPQHSSQAWFLTQEEKEFAVERMHRDSGGQDYQAEGITFNDVKLALKDWKIWMTLPTQIIGGIPGNAVPVFLPLIVRSLGYESYRANLYSVPIYVVGAAGLWTIAYCSDRWRDRTLFLLIAYAFQILGLTLVACLSGAGGRYAALCIMQIGLYATPPLYVAVLANNTPTPGHRAIIISLNAMSNINGIPGGQLFRAKFAPLYRVPFYVSLGCAAYAFLAIGVFRYLMIRVNKRRQTKLETSNADEIDEENTTNTRIGDKKWTFIYTL
ncbi:hypothetical protein I317_05075 [Kwoniella heveanensis CBS 569]|nr:hypothetical protein I317_05075 [Kwoniella heveanensis CBS 569]